MGLALSQVFSRLILVGWALLVAFSRKTATRITRDAESEYLPPDKAILYTARLHI